MTTTNLSSNEQYTEKEPDEQFSLKRTLSEHSAGYDLTITYRITVPHDFFEDTSLEYRAEQIQQIADEIKEEMRPKLFTYPQFLMLHQLERSFKSYCSYHRLVPGKKRPAGFLILESSDNHNHRSVWVHPEHPGWQCIVENGVIVALCQKGETCRPTTEK